MRFGFYEALDVLKLKILCDEVCDNKNRTAIYNTLLRNKVRNIDVLRICDQDKVKERFRTIGDKRLEFIKDMIDICNDGEKIRDILSKNEDLKRLEDSRPLYELANDLYNNHNCSVAEISKITGLKKETVRMIAV